MEVTEEVSEEKTDVVLKPTKTRNCNYCNKEYEYIRATSKFCSDLCKDKAHQASRTSRLGNIVPTKEPAHNNASKTADSLLNSLPAHYQIAVDLLKDDRDNWKQMYKELLGEKKTVDKTVIELRDALRDKETSLKGLEDAAPNGFEKFMAAIPSQVMDAIAPSLGQLFQKAVGGIGGSPGLQMSGVDGQLDAEAQTKLQMINTWYCSLTAELREKVYEILNFLASAKSEQEMKDLLTQLTNLLKNGTVIQQQYNNNFGFSPTGT